MKFIIRVLILLFILGVVTVAFALRMRAVELLPIDYDEDDYLSAAQHYANAISERDIDQIINYDFNYEHPPLAKIVYGLSILPLPEAPRVPEQSPGAPIVSSLPEPHLQVARTASAIMGTLEVLVLAIANPLAGLLLAVNTWQIKYTSQVMLEALPSLTSILAVLFYIRSRRRMNIWLILSALMFSFTVASKYIYGIVGIAILVDWIIAARSQEDGQKFETRSLMPILLWGGVSILAFFVVNPRLWTDPINRLVETVAFHGEYATSDQVQRAGFPSWQPLVWLFGSVPWHPGVFLVMIDALIAIFALLGIRRLWKKRRVMALWFALALLVLLVWPTKWPQYVLILTVPLSIAAAEGVFGSLWEPFQKLAYRLRKTKPAEPAVIQPQSAVRSLLHALPWLLPGLIVLGLIAVYPMVFQSAMSLTDFESTAIRDGLNGGVWREVRLGLSGQVEPLSVDPSRRSASKQVHYVGPGLIISLLMGAGADILVFGLIWTILSIVGQTGVGVMVALLLHRPGVRLKGLWRAIFILPWAIPEFVGALMWSQIFDPRFGYLSLAGRTWYERADYPGAINYVTQWQQNPDSALFVLLITAIWYGFPFMMLVATAALKLLPGELYDAAAIDGASAWGRFHLITWPMLVPLLIPAIIIRSIFAFNQFYIFYVLRPPFPLATFSITSFFIFDGGQYAVSAAINIFTVLVLAVMIIWFNRWSRAGEGVYYAT